jgi:quercetin dioxygenase-like cupin family protein
VKRVVTGWNENGEAAILFEGEPATTEFPYASAHEVWRTDSAPANTARSDDAVPSEFELLPSPGGSVFRLATYPPGAEVPLHSTDTLDYIIVISGELTMTHPGGEVTLHPGDTIVQQATPHGWANRTDVPCVVAAVLLDGAKR